MPAGMTYDSLYRDVQTYIQRGFTSSSDPIVYAKIADFITAAERRCARELKVLGFQTSVTWTMATGQCDYEKPDRWRETVSMGLAAGTGLDEYEPIFPRAYEYCRAYWPRPLATTARPRYYADYGFNNWLFAPTPDRDYPIETTYWEQPAFLDETTQTNWLTDQAPDLLLYAALLESGPFLRSPDMVQTWQVFYDRHFASTNGEDLQRVLDRSQNRSTS